MNILITGAAGFIGSHLVHYHLQKKHRVWGVDHLHTGRIENISSVFHHPHFQFDQHDVCSWPKIREAVEWADHIYHMAAVVGQKLVLMKPIETLSNNIKSCEALLETLASTHSKAPILIASSSGVYGRDHRKMEDAFREETLLGIDPAEYVQEGYYLSKLVNESMSLAYAQTKGVHCVLARIFNTVGTGQLSQYGMVIPTFIEQALAEVPMTVFGDGLQSRSFCNVLDTVHMLDLLLHSPAAYSQIVNVGAPEAISMLHLAEIIREKTHSSSKIVFVPYEKAYGMAFKDIYERKPDLHKLEGLISFRHQWSLDDTLDQMIAFSKKVIFS